MKKNYSWFKIAESKDAIVFGMNDLAVIEVNGKTMAMGKYRNQLFAFAHKCPHAGGIMTEGWIDSRGNVVCPVHGYRFEMETGRNISGEGYNLKYWPVECREDGVFVGMEEGLFSWF